MLYRIIHITNPFYSPLISGEKLYKKINVLHLYYFNFNVTKCVSVADNFCLPNNNTKPELNATINTEFEALFCPVIVCM